MSLRRRLALLTVGAFTVGLVVLGIVVPKLVGDFLTDRLDEELRRASGFAAVAVTAPDGGPFADGPGGGPVDGPVDVPVDVPVEVPVEVVDEDEDVDDDDDPASTSLLDEVYAEVRTGDGRLISGEFLDPRLGSRSTPDLPETLLPRPRPFTVDGVGERSPHHWRVQVFELVGRPGSDAGLLVVALPMSEVDETVSQVVRIAVTTSAIALVVVGGLAWWLIGLGLRPLKKMERSAASIADAGDLARRVEHPAPTTEIGRLGVTLNHMLERLDESFAAQRATEMRVRRFAADASHELRTPLTSIRGYAELYRHGGDDAEQVARSMTRIEEESARMSRLVEDLLLLARSDEGLQIAREDVDLAEVARNLVDDLRVVEPQRTVSFEGARAIVVGDRHRLTQAIANVLANARMHTPPGTPIEVTVRTAVDQQDRPVAEVEVADHGPGLPAEDAQRVFDRFYRADTSRSRREGAGGSGLGLSITDAIVRAHDGSITVGPTPGGGATFTIRVPLRPV